MIPIKRFNAWLATDDRQLSLWPAMLPLSPDYFESLLAHAVPVPFWAVAPLTHSAMALDILTWMARPGLTPETREDLSPISAFGLRPPKTTRRRFFLAASHAQKAADLLHAYQAEPPPPDPSRGRDLSGGLMVNFL